MGLLPTGLTCWRFASRAAGHDGLELGGGSIPNKHCHHRRRLTRSQPRGGMTQTAVGPPVHGQYRMPYRSGDGAVGHALPPIPSGSADGRVLPGSRPAWRLGPARTASQRGRAGCQVRSDVSVHRTPVTPPPSFHARRWVGARRAHGRASAETSPVTRPSVQSSPDQRGSNHVRDPGRGVDGDAVHVCCDPARHGRQRITRGRERGPPNRGLLRPTPMSAPEATSSPRDDRAPPRPAETIAELALPGSR